MPAAKKTKKPETKPISGKRNDFSHLTLIFFAVVFAGIGAYLLLRSFAAPAPPTMYLSPASQVMPINNTFTVQVRENSGTTAVNAVQANLTYPTSLLTFVSMSTTGTAFSTAGPSSGGGGTVSIAAGTPCTTTCSTVTGDQLIATITFKSTTTGGAAAVAFATGTALVSSSTNQNLLPSLASTAGGTYTTDTGAPTVSISSPANNANLAAGGTTNISITASDALSSVASVDVYVDGVKKTTITTPPYTYPWNTTGLALGAHTIQAKATDSFGNLGSSSTITVNLTDQTAPSAPGSLRATGNSYTTIALAWNASTDNVGVTGYRIQRNGTTLTTVNGSTLTYNDSGLTVGTSYNYTVVALDAAGNASTAATLTTSTASQKPGDINGDGQIDITDLSILLSNWGTANAASDLNKNGLVDIFDLSILLSNFGS